VGTPSLASATARSNSPSAICRGTVTCNMTTATSALPSPRWWTDRGRAFSEKGPNSPLRPRAPRKPDDPSSLTPVLYRASGLTGQAVALLLYLLYEHFVGVDELLHALRLQHLYYVVVVHAGLL
jgi:hypothetical protein